MDRFVIGAHFFQSKIWSSRKLVLVHVVVHSGFRFSTWNSATGWHLIFCILRILLADCCYFIIELLTQFNCRCMSEAIVVSVKSWSLSVVCLFCTDNGVWSTPLFSIVDESLSLWTNVSHFILILRSIVVKVKFSHLKCGSLT